MMWASGAALAVVTHVAARAADPLAVAFGARPLVRSASLSPDGKKIALVTSGEGRSERLLIVDVDSSQPPKQILAAAGDPEHLFGCSWIANDRLICRTGGYQNVVDTIFGFSNLIALGADGADLRTLETRKGDDAHSIDLRGGALVDLLPGEDAHALIARAYVPESRIGSSIAKTAEGLAVDNVDTRTGRASTIEHARPDADLYISDGDGKVRLMAVHPKLGPGYDSEHVIIEYRKKDSNDWQKLGDYNQATQEGFFPLIVDPETDRAIGIDKIDGRRVIAAVGLDGSNKRETLFSRPDVDVEEVLTIGQSRRMVGVSYVTDFRHDVFFDAGLKTLLGALSKATGGKTLWLADASKDEKRLLLESGSATDPGQIYLFDKSTGQLMPIITERPQLEKLTLAITKAVSYPAADGTMIPAYLTLPADKDAHGLPAIVMPHGGPSARDEGGFDWMVQYFVARGFAVIQPNFRGSSGYGDQWFVDNGFKSWKLAVGDVVDAGHWLVDQGIAAPDKLTVFGWSYGGYAALQSAVVAPDLFKAVVAVAPVTDLESLVANERNWSDYRLVEMEVGTGPHLKNGSPAQNVDAFKAPVLMFQGTLDRNVPIQQSKMMEARLESAHKRSQLVVFEGLDHQLDDSKVRAQLLEQSADFLLTSGKPGT